jgi:predicted peptidase
MLRRELVSGLVLVILFSISREASAIVLADFADYSLRSASNQILLPGRLYTPPEAQVPNAAPRPLIINLAGSGGNGTDNLTQLYFLTDEMLGQAEQRGAFIYAPQTASSWSTTTVTSQVMTMIDRAITTLNADTNRIYIMGYSLGSYGTWTMLSRYDGRFAAAVPVSGGVPASDFVAARLIDTPIFAFHARDDPSASVSATRSVISSILAADHQAIPTYLPSNDTRDFMISNPSLPIHQAFSAEAHQFANVTDFFISDPRMDLLYYERATGGHVGVLAAYNTPEVYDWMFVHTTAVPEPSACVFLLTGGIAAATTTSRRYTRQRIFYGEAKKHILVGALHSIFLHRHSIRNHGMTAAVRNTRGC